MIFQSLQPVCINSGACCYAAMMMHSLTAACSVKKPLCSLQDAAEFVVLFMHAHNVVLLLSC